ncbi:hypothetical protein SAMN05660772_02073 [Pasteurella testudinis DSM 23072]|uniref:Uncharacterized protein n=1 Tax=Pasteurella testudinis DSM 23072 TaxID=1122938 RepID=A0A1W1UMV2_9PAST|nr:hypothetical protein [Pasteurella testudinis]SMB82353.1 hypothetical protein SAMN05660772_02073 [Pasteurella testudinis DSM 23072]SUB52241.1 Uncharacterised protein [Pasteurella testudinis]
MIKQKNHKKVTAYGKKRVNLFELEQRVTALENAAKRQGRVNGHQYRVNANVNLLLDLLEEKITELQQQQKPKRTFLQWLLMKLGR